MKKSRFIPSVLGAAFLTAWLGTAPLFAAPPASDEIWIYGNGQLVRASLATGAVEPAIPAPPGLAQLAALPSGEVLATSRTAGPPYQVALGELRPDGSLRPIGVVDPPPVSFGNDYPIELTVDPRGRLYLVVLGQANFPHGHGFRFLAELEPETAATVGTPAVISGVSDFLPTAPDGLWLVDGERRLLDFDPDTRVATPIGRQLPLANGRLSDVAADSAGRLWYVAEPALCGAPCPSQLFFYDPATGESGAAPAALTAEIPGVQAIAIRRSCADSPTVRCLNGGRFRAEVEFAAYDGAAGAAQVARGGRSSDTAIFTFFDPDNWELMVKVLDGCAINSHFWVYAAASTDVEYTMTVTDLKTGARKIYRNPLGQVAETVTDNLAFTCHSP